MEKTILSTAQFPPVTFPVIGDLLVTLLAGIKEKGLTLYRKPLDFLARQEGFEPPTYRFVACCSIQLGYWRVR